MLNQRIIPDLNEREQAPKFELVDNAEGTRRTWDDFPKDTHIDETGVLDKLSPKEILRQQIEMEHEGSKAVMRSGYFLYRLWITGAFQDIVKNEGDPRWPWTAEGFYKFLHEFGSHLSPSEISARQSVYATYCRYPKDIRLKVDQIGVNKARLAAKHVKLPDVVEDNAQVAKIVNICLETPHHALQDVLDKEFPVARRGRGKKSKLELKRDDHVRAMRVIRSLETGKLGGILETPWMFIPRQFRLSEADEYRAMETFQQAINRLRPNDRDSFWMQVVRLVGETWLTPEERDLIERVAATKSPDDAYNDTDGDGC